MAHDLTGVPHEHLPLALADIHASTGLGDVVEVRLPASCGAALAADLLVGAGLERCRHSPRATTPDRLVARRVESLPDTIGPGMRMLVCGLNPSPAAAEAGVGFFRAGNRFWPAALAARLVTRDRDPFHALTVHGIGMTDLVKRTTARADELSVDEYQAGVARLDRLCTWLQPAVVCLVGLAGWRAAADRRALAGQQPATLGGRPVYVMPSTSGLNASSSLADLTEHLEAAAALV
ncbi:MAG: mismatch-specific DNA-glycosylase [Acidimicrobiia bacterium]|nr:mismatch-specific DNA-glycosylase [Acidimicrobiia bacterium]